MEKYIFEEKVVTPLGVIDEIWIHEDHHLSVFVGCNELLPMQLRFESPQYGERMYYQRVVFRIDGVEITHENSPSVYEKWIIKKGDDKMTLCGRRYYTFFTLDLTIGKTGRLLVVDCTYFIRNDIYMQFFILSNNTIIYL